ncbi:cache domain-containing protein [Phytoactinopolyspora limicola]|uniref:cache domain-containing protein n=1 Tax=Phytoactinopolyspora limicola TaxID=2715536 RepID=UPI00140A53F8|nr:cache domain-containing protein [Phytoactinopolyspora limicola]
MVQVAEQSALHSVAHGVDAFFERIFAILESWQPSLRITMAEAIRSGELTADRLETLVEPSAHAAIDQSNLPVYGAGFIAAADVMDGAGSPIAWWQGPDKARLVGSTDFADRGYIEYQRLEWFRVPRETHQLHITGPYVDYLCSTELALTTSMPLTIDAKFVGVSCIDVLVESLEPVLVAAVDAHGTNLSVVNSDERVVVSSHPLRATGDHLPADPAPRGMVRCTSAPFHVIAH